jgi:hypothetical protein
MNSAKLLAYRGLGIILGIALFLIPASGQEGSAPQTKAQPAAQALPALDGAAVDEANATPAPSAPNPYRGAITNVGTGLPFLGTTSTLRWWDFSIARFEYIGVRDQFDPQGPAPPARTDFSLLRAAVVFDHYFRQTDSRIVLQYLPQLLVTNGRLRAANGANNNVTIGTTFRLTPRARLTLMDTFVQVSSNPLIPENYLNADAQEGALVQNTFLDTNGSFISDTATATLEYDLSPRATLTIAPSYRYAKSINNLPTYIANGDLYQGVATLGYALAPHITVGILDTYQLLEQKTLGNPTQPAHFNTAGFFYSQQLGRTFWITGNVGAESQKYADLPVGNNWGVGGGASIIKTFSSDRIGFSLAYARGLTFVNYITNRNADHVDVSLSLKPTRRITLNTGIGYYREFGFPPLTNGKYGTADLEYNFYGHFNVFSTLDYGFQDFGVPELQSGTRRTVAYGIRWMPPVLHPR